jgi:hypothetical protein
LCFRQKHFAGVRQLDPTWHPPEKGRTQFFFQRSYLLAKRRLSNANLFGGASKIHFFGDRQKISNVTQFHIHLLKVSNT